MGRRSDEGGASEKSNKFRRPIHQTISALPPSLSFLPFFAANAANFYLARQYGGNHSFRPQIRKRFREFRARSVRCYRALPAFSCLAAMPPSFIKTRRKEEVTERERRGKVHAGCAHGPSNEKETAQIQREERGRKKEARGREKREDGVSLVTQLRHDYFVLE